MDIPVALMLRHSPGSFLSPKSIVHSTGRSTRMYVRRSLVLSMSDNPDADTADIVRGLVTGVALSIVYLKRYVPAKKACLQSEFTQIRA